MRSRPARALCVHAPAFVFAMAEKVQGTDVGVNRVNPKAADEPAASVTCATQLHPEVVVPALKGIIRVGIPAVHAGGG